jgi:hypothetical protein
MHESASGLKKLTKPPYKGDSGAWYTKALFYEEAIRHELAVRVVEPVFTLNSEIEGLICARTTFIELEDPTGYKWAMKYLKSWPHFEKLLGCSWFAPHYANWVAEIKIILKARALEQIKQIAAGCGEGVTSAVMLQANKYLASAEWEKPLFSRGRPSKGEISGELKRLTEQIAMEDNDIERIGGLKLIQGGKK